MDINIHYLDYKHVKLIQDISTFEIFQRYPICDYRNLRERVNVIIEIKDKKGLFPKYDKITDEKIRDIREIFKKERLRRNEERKRICNNPKGSSVEEWYDVRWGDNTPDYPDDYIEKFPEDIQEAVDSNYESYDEYDRLIDEYSDILTHQDCESMLGLESYSELSNYDLRVLALELFRLKSKQLHAEKDTAFASGTITLGEHYRYADPKRKDDIFLLIDNIIGESVAIGCNFEDLFAITYIHELFHALYAYHSDKDVIFLKHFHEIEEAMAEMGTIYFCEEYDKKHSTTLKPLAEKIIQDKWNSSNTSLACYGLGYHLYKAFSQWNKCLDAINKYQVIQRIIRFGNKHVSDFCSLLKIKDELGCINSIYNLFSQLGSIKPNTSQHLYFDGHSYGELITTVEKVLKHYADNNYGRIPKVVHYGWKQNNVFINRASWNHLSPQDKRKYSEAKAISLQNGTELLPWANWQKGLNENTIHFIDRIVFAYKHGWISETISII